MSFKERLGRFGREVRPAVLPFKCMAHFLTLGLVPFSREDREEISGMIAEQQARKKDAEVSRAYLLVMEGSG